MEGLSTFSLREILQEPPEEADWIIEDLITTGLHLLVGPPKAGKSWLALDMAISVAQGESFLGFATAKSDVLYLALEDTRNRLKTRSWNTADLRSYVEAINLGQRPCESEEIDEVTHYNDIITTSLRTRKGLYFSAVPERFRGYLLNSAQRSIQSGLLEKKTFADDTVLCLTREGLFVSDDVMSDLIFVDE